jgi:hypothetical protein
MTIASHKFGFWPLAFWRTMEALAWAICAFCVYLTLRGLFTEYWWNDFQYFWLAGRMTLEGVSPYGPEYLERGMASAMSFSAPFFYPPSILPLLAPLGAIEMNLAASAYFCVNLGLIVISAILLARIIARLVPGVDMRAAAALAAFALVVCFEPTMIGVGIGQTSMLFMTASVLFAYGAVFRSDTMFAAALCVLLIKPHFGAPFLALALARGDTRFAAAVGVAANGALTLIGLLAFNGGLSDLALFLANVSSYADHHANSIVFAAGLPAIAAFAGAPFSAAFGACAAMAVAFVLGRMDRGGISPAAVAATAAAALFMVPTHATDFPLAAPALAALAAARNLPAATLLALGFALLARGSHADELMGLSGEQGTSLVVAVHTVGLSLVFAPAAALVMEERPANAMRGAPCSPRQLRTRRI